jgi:hypothetical protein
MPRPGDDEYYVDDRTEHVTQGDIFRDILFIWTTSVDGEQKEVGFEGYGMLITYTSGMMLQPPGSRGYKHDFRLVAPIFSFPMLMDQGLSEEILMEIRRSDKYTAYMYLPAYPQEFEESAVLPYRAALVEQRVLEQTRVTQLQRPAALQLQLKLATTFLGGKWNPDDLNPDLDDHWNV